jgi:hypothetical protein
MNCVDASCLQLLLHQNGLTDLYMARTASTIVGAQALVMSALQGSRGSEDAWRLMASGDGSQQGVRGLGAQPQGKRQLKKAISSKMQRQVRLCDGNGSSLLAPC